MRLSLQAGPTLGLLACALWLASFAQDATRDARAGLDAVAATTQRLPNQALWPITIPGTAKSVRWVDAGNRRFAVWDNDTPSDWRDDVVLDKETGLIWERAPHDQAGNSNGWWEWAMNAPHLKNWSGFTSNVQGWRLPTIEELQTLLDQHTADHLPPGHPFLGVSSSAAGSGLYWSATPYVSYNPSTLQTSTFLAFAVDFQSGSVLYQSKDSHAYHWCVRGGAGASGT